MTATGARPQILRRKGTVPVTIRRDVLLVNSDLVRAIRDKRLIEFVYKTGRTRTVEPHDYGVRRGVESMLGYQISGESRSGAPHGWRWYVVAEMYQLRLLDQRFTGTRADAGQDHRDWDTLFARVS